VFFVVKCRFQVGAERTGSLKKRLETIKLGKGCTSQGEREGEKERDARDSRGAPNRERKRAMDSVTKTFGDEGNSFQNVFP
jgi:hypothetical protein